MSYFVTVCPFSEVWKILRVVGRGFLTWLGTRFSTEKFSCSLFPHYLPTVESRTARKVSLTDCLWKLGKNTIHPLLCLVLQSQQYSSLWLPISILSLSFLLALSFESCYTLSLLRPQTFCLFFCPSGSSRMTSPTRQKVDKKQLFS